MHNMLILRWSYAAIATAVFFVPMPLFSNGVKYKPFSYSGVSVHPDRISKRLLSRNQYIFLDKPSLFSKRYQYQIYVYVLGV